MNYKHIYTEMIKIAYSKAIKGKRSQYYFQEDDENIYFSEGGFFIGIMPKKYNVLDIQKLMDIANSNGHNWVTLPRLKSVLDSCDLEQYNDGCLVKNVILEEQRNRKIRTIKNDYLSVYVDDRFLKYFKKDCTFKI